MSSALTSHTISENWLSGTLSQSQIGLAEPNDTPDHMSLSSSTFASFLQQKELEMQTYRRELQDAITKLRGQYVFINPDQLTAFLESHQSLPHLLLEAVPQLNIWFGPDSLKKLEISDAGDEPATLRATVLWPGSIEDANAALNAFDKNYWIANYAKAYGKLVIDRELV